ncbi:neuronal acetylcholine receptor subunit alpha-10-like [Homarus americanus]|uniref:neuronal acetylcholine receptor subunit alpha-10-like n=1 Tax=Homarus americanus TaxID=6706 RepID=UPI001C4513E9|nr:neuronal acetylcholine receptor subunit alpha-10-like [Homarus americanus]
MLAMMVFLMAMTENLPPTEDLPLAGVYYGVCLIVLTFNILFSVYVLNLSYSGDRGYPVPLWFRYWTVFCARMVRMKIPKFIVGAWNLDENLRIRKDQVEPLSDDDDDEDVKKNFDVRVIKVNPATIEEKTDVFKDPFQRRSIEALEGIHRLLSKEATDHKAQLKKTSLMEQWRYLSRVMDRFLFILFGIGTLLFNTIILTQSPFGEKFEYCPHGFGMCSDDYSFDSSSSEAGHF